MIIEIKEQINKLITGEGKKLSSKEVVKLSQELDKLVVEQIRKMNKHLITK